MAPKSRYARAMSELLAVEVVRNRPGMYVGDPDSDESIANLVHEVVSNSYDQYLAGRCTKLAVELAADGTITIEDDGPGMPAAGGDGLPPLDRLLTHLSTRPSRRAHRHRADLARERDAGSLSRGSGDLPAPASAARGAHPARARRSRPGPRRTPRPRLRSATASRSPRRLRGRRRAQGPASAAAAFAASAAS